MNAIMYAINQIKYTIPREILEKTFIPNCPFSMQPLLSLDSLIEANCIRKRVLVDCNMVGGTETWIRLAGVPRENPDPFTFIYRIPKTITHGRSITAALSVAFGEGYIIAGTNLLPVRGNALLDAGAGLLNSASPIPLVSTAKVHLIADNTILVADNMALPTNIFLRCWLENDTNLNNINPRSFSRFSKLVVLGVKSYIYNTLIIKMDKGEIFAGAQLGTFKEIVDSYSDAEEQYQTYLTEVWAKVAFLNDGEAHRRHLQLITGGLW